MQEHYAEDGTPISGGPHVVPADSSAPSAFPGTESIEGVAVENGPGKAARRTTKASGSANLVKGLLAKVPWDVRAKLAVVFSFGILVTVFILNRPWVNGKSKPQTLLAKIPNNSPKEPGEKQAPEPPLIVEKNDSKDPKADKIQPKVASEPVREANSESPPPLPPEIAKEEAGKGKLKESVSESAQEMPPEVPTAVKVSEAPTEAPPALSSVVKVEPKPKEVPPPVDIPPAIIGESKPVEATPLHEPPIEVAKPEVKPVEIAPATMPELAATPSTSEAPKEPVSTASAPAGGGGFAIPSAGLVRASVVNAAKKAPVSNETILAVSAPPRAVPAAPSEMGQTAAANGEIHVVGRGENFWTISRYHYASGRFYKALWYANRDLVKAPDDLYVGTPIRIPQVEDLNRELIEVPKTARANGRPSADASPGAAGRDSKTQKASAAKPNVRPSGTLPVAKEADTMTPIPINAKRAARRAEEPTYRTYVVLGRNETLRSVARSQLGDVEREDEIYRLNESEFEGDSYKLRVGMTLKIPDETRKR